MLFIKFIALWLIVGHLVFGVSLFILWAKAHKHGSEFTFEWSSEATLKFAIFWPLYLVKVRKWLKMMNDALSDGKPS